MGDCVDTLTAAQGLGRSRTWILKAISDGELEPPTVRVGKCYLWSPADVGRAKELSERKRRKPKAAKVAKVS